MPLNASVVCSLLLLFYHCIDIPEFIYSPVYGHLGSQFWVTMHTAIINILVYVHVHS